MKIRKVSPELLDRPTAATARPPSARELRRRALERELGSAISAATANADAAFLVEPGKDEKLPAIRLAFRRVRDQMQAVDVNLFVRAGAILIAKRPQTRGRRPSR
jgi:hypothetical protein